VTAKLLSAAPGGIVLCSVVVAELLYGAHRSAQTARNLVQVRTFCSGFASIVFDDAAAEEYGAIRAHLDRAGTPIGPNDLLISAIARSRSLILVTHNVAEFSRVSGLQIEDWQVP
jgi:tRNA(fMet)-specific endonuclease VapC